MRNNLHIVLQCNDCGSALDMTYDEPKSKHNAEVSRPNVGTGAAVLMSKITVIPCHYCKEEYTKPLKYMKMALEKIGELEE